MMRRQAVVFLGAVLAVPLLVPAAVLAQASPGGGGCVEWDIAGQCVKEVPVLVSVPQEPSTGDRPETAKRPTSPPPNCYWRTVPVIPGIEGLIGAPPAEMEQPVLQAFQCDELSLPETYLGLPIAFQWADAGAADEPTPMTAEALAQILYLRVRARMAAPQVASDPPVSSVAVVNVPVFVQVANWQPPIVDTECDPVSGLCVTMTATPGLSWLPGEPGAPQISCDAPGSRFDPGGPSAADQAARPGACAWTYSMRTGIEGRPDAWPGQVVVDWSVGWSATNGDDGVFPGLEFTTAAPRAVNEVQTVVADSE